MEEQLQDTQEKAAPKTPSRRQRICRHLNKRGGTYAGVVIVGIILAGAGSGFARIEAVQRSNGVDGQYRDRAAAVKLAEANRLTDGEVRLVRAPAGYGNYDWDAQDGRLNVNLWLGICRVSGYVLSPVRPMSPQAAGPLYVKLEYTHGAHSVKADVAVTDPTFRQKVVLSDESFCVAGNSWNQRTTPQPPDGA